MRLLCERFSTLSTITPENDSYFNYDTSTFFATYEAADIPLHWERALQLNNTNLLRAKEAGVITNAHYYPVENRSKMTSNTYYSSVESQILIKAVNEPYNYYEASIDEIHLDIREKVMQHVNQQVTAEEKEWLAELLLWEKLFPAEKPGFPGERPNNPNHPHLKVAHGYLPSCRTCVEQELKKEDCPYVRHITCEEKVEHPVYFVRLGSEDFLGPDCPACYGEELDGRGKKKVDERGKSAEGKE